MSAQHFVRNNKFSGRARRMVIITDYTILQLMKDYLGEKHIPDDATVYSLAYNRLDGRLMLTWRADSAAGEQPTKTVSFKTKDSYSMGGFSVPSISESPRILDAHGRETGTKSPQAMPRQEKSSDQRGSEPGVRDRDDEIGPGKPDDHPSEAPDPA